MEPMFSVVVPLYNTPQDLLTEMIGSVRGQTFSDWELVLVDDASPDGTTAVRAQAFVEADPRIRLVPLEVNRGIAEATNVGLGLARGTFIALLDHDDLLAETALEEVHTAIVEGTDVDYVYTDEDKIGEDGFHYDTFLKPDWSPERLLGQMYTSHLSVFRRSILDTMKPFDTKYNGSQDHELVLRITERARSIVHVPRPLYHWRAVEGSTALSGAEKSYAWDAGVAALKETLVRRGIDGEAMRGPAAGIYYVKRAPIKPRRVSIVIVCTGSERGVELKPVFRDLQRTSYGRRSTILVVGSTAQLAEAASALGRRWARVKRVVVDENASDIARRSIGILTADTEIVLVVDGRAHLGDPRVLTELLMPLNESDVALSGGRLLDQRGKTILHAGYRYAWDLSRHPYRGAPKESLGRIGALISNREVSAVCTVFAAVRRASFIEVGGFNGSLDGAAADFDLGAKLRAAGGRIVTVSRAEVSLSDLGAADAKITDAERALLVERWGPPGRDPFTA